MKWQSSFNRLSVLGSITTRCSSAQRSTVLFRSSAVAQLQLPFNSASCASKSNCMLAVTTTALLFFLLLCYVLTLLLNNNACSVIFAGNNQRMLPFGGAEGARTF
jgi:hypothetical protein